MEARSKELRGKELRGNVLKGLITLYAHEHDEIEGHELLEYKATDSTGNISIIATLKKIGSSNELKTITLDLSELHLLVVDVAINELWRQLLEWGFKNEK